MSRRTTMLLCAASAGLVVAPCPIHAHHEAIFGPHSSVAFSAPGFLSLQAFTRQLGVPGARTQETTFALSGGVTPFPRVPLSLALIAPFAHIADLDAGTGRVSLEDLTIGARYRLDLTGLQRRWNRDGNYLMGLAAVELPVGNTDHPAFDGPVSGMFAALASLERGPLSAIAYAFYRHNGWWAGGSKGDNLFVGGGLAYTPFDDPATERLLSFQLGCSYEWYFRDVSSGRTVDASGGQEFLVHPTIVWGPGGRVLLFALASIPVHRAFRDPTEQDRWRVGAGVIWAFGR